MIRNRYFLIIGFFVIAIMITIISCGRKGSLNPNMAPFIEISKYNGVAKPDSIATDSTLFHEIGSLINLDIYDSLFSQQIFWNAWDEDGTIKGYAYRIGTWDSTSNEWIYDKAYGISVDDEGWVLHEQPNGEFDIWTSAHTVSARVYFPSTDTTDFRKNFGMFEVKCKDNRGAECENSSKRYFITHSEIPTTFISTSQGALDLRRVGTAILFEFYVNDGDPFGLGREAAYYKYRVVNVERIGAREDTLGEGSEGYEFSVGTEILPNSDTTWYSTKDSENPAELFLRFDANNVNELTQLQVKAVDKAGIEDPNYATSTFFVRDYFKPSAAPFINNPLSGELNVLREIFVLGNNHYLTYLSVDEEIVSKIIDGVECYATQFYYNKDGILSALWSDDIEIHMKWEYLGEYEYDSDNGIQYAGNTYFYDEGINQYIQYFCDIEYMEIQLDNDVAGIPPIGTVITDSITGENWMRVPIYEDQKCKLFNAQGTINLLPGNHVFRVRALDFQGAVDPNPQELEFDLLEIPDEMDGILLVDDTVPGTPFAIEGDVNAFYRNLLENCTETTIDTFFLNVSATPGDSPLYYISVLNMEIGHSEKPYFAPSDLMKYKLIIWHYNNPKGDYFNDVPSHLKTHYDLLSIYINNGGNLLFSGSSGIGDPELTNNPFLQDYAGFSESSYTVNKSISWSEGSPNQNNSIFIGAAGVGDFSEIDSIRLNPNIYKWPNNNYYPKYFPPNTYLGAIGGITFFDLYEGTPIFNFIPKLSVSDPENYNGCIGSKYIKEEGKTGITYILGFPLYYILLDDAKLFINKVFDEVGINYQE